MSMWLILEFIRSKKNCFVIELVKVKRFSHTVKSLTKAAYI